MASVFCADRLMRHSSNTRWSIHKPYLRAGQTRLTQPSFFAFAPVALLRRGELSAVVTQSAKITAREVAPSLA